MPHHPETKAGSVTLCDIVGRQALEIARQEEHIEALKSSTSWRITKPIRFLGEIARRFHRNRRTADSSGTNSAYMEWIRAQRAATHARVRPAAATDPRRFGPRISILLPVHDPPVEFLDEAVQSVRGQSYGAWELCIVDDASKNPRVRDLIREYAAGDTRIRVTLLDRNAGISGASNAALELATGEWVVLLDHDDLLSQDALYWLAETIRRKPAAKIVYSDEDKIGPGGDRESPYFKPDWNRTLFYSHHLLAHMAAYENALVRSVGGFRSEFDGAQDYDLALRCVEQVSDSEIVHIPRVLYHWRIHDKSTAKADGDAKPHAMLKGEKALNEHFARTDTPARAHLTGHGYRVRYKLPEPPPLASIVILTKDKYSLLSRCINSLLAETDYPHFEILLIDNGTKDEKALGFLAEAPQRGNIRVIRDEGTFNFSRLNNRAVALAQGDVVVLLNNDTEVINDSWLREMVSLAVQPKIGAVGALLLFRDGTVQHGGVVLGINNWAGHAHKHYPGNSPGHAGRLALSSEFSAVTGACLAVRRSTYIAEGGLDEELSVACNDIDFCLRLRERGYRNVFTPFAQLYHHESASRGSDKHFANRVRHEEELRLMRARWGERLLADPHYNPNLTLETEDFALAFPPRVDPLPAPKQAD